MLRILNIGLDRDVLHPGEAQDRQRIYAELLPASVSHVVKAPPGVSAEKIELTDNVSIFPCPVRRWPLFLPAAIKRGFRILRQSHFDIIQVQEPFVSGSAGAILSRLFRLPLVVSVFSDEIDNPVWVRANVINRIANVIGKLVLQSAASIRCDSRAVAEKLAAVGYRQVRYVPFLITHADELLKPHQKAEEIREQFLQGDKGPLLLTVARLEPEKNIDLSLRSFGEALKKFPEAAFVIAGDGSCRSDLESLAAKISRDRIYFVGRIPNQDIPAFYQAADLTLLSSTRESAARVLFESLLAGTPVLTTATAGADEAIKNNQTGRIVAVGDDQAFTRALLELCGDQNLASMGKAGKAQTADIVTQDAVVEGLRSVYNLALAA